MATTTKTPRDHGFEDGETMAREEWHRLGEDPDADREWIRAEVAKLAEGVADESLINGLGAREVEKLFGLPANASEVAREAWSKALDEYNEGFREGVRATLRYATIP